MNIKHKGRLLDTLIANGLPVHSIGNDAAGNLRLCWAVVNPTQTQVDQAEQIVRTFDDTPTLDEKLVEAAAHFPRGDVAMKILALKATKVWNTLTQNERQEMDAWLERQAQAMLEVIRR